ncbi:MAG TPA: aromatic amino acid lyase, partial [Micropepsaceae bacterium]|nr:aromatic amino acid lyase [Micropepsaceae bacterium]
MSAELSCGSGNWTLGEAKRLIAGPITLSLTQDARARIARSHETIAAIIRDNRVVYGINTGFGLLANTRIAPADLEALQENLVLSHAAGTGAPLSDETVRLVLALKVNSLARGASGVRQEVVEALISLLKVDALPVIPSQGSVGASGDLAPLAHLSAALLGHGT